MEHIQQLVTNIFKMDSSKTSQIKIEKSHNMSILIPKDFIEPSINEILQFFNINITNLQKENSQSNPITPQIKKKLIIPDKLKIPNSCFIGQLNFKFLLYNNTPEDALQAVQDYNNKSDENLQNEDNSQFIRENSKNLVLISTFSKEESVSFLKQFNEKDKIPFCLFLNTRYEGNFNKRELYSTIKEKEIDIFDIVVFKYKSYNVTDILITLIKMYLCYNQLEEEFTFYHTFSNISLPKPKHEISWEIDFHDKFLNFQLKKISNYEKLNFYLCGPSGSGKSTLINILLGEKRSNSGTAGSMTIKPNKYTHTKYPICFYDSRGWEQGTFGEQMFFEIKDIINKNNKKTANGVFRLHAIFLFFNMGVGRGTFEEVIKIIKIIKKSKIPFFYVITHAGRNASEKEKESFSKLKEDTSYFKGTIFIDSKEMYGIAHFLNKVYTELQKENEIQQEEQASLEVVNPIVHKYLFDSENFYIHILLHNFIKLNVFLRNLKNDFSNDDFDNIVQSKGEKYKEFVNVLMLLRKEIFNVFGMEYYDDNNFVKLWKSSSDYYGMTFEEIYFSFIEKFGIKDNKYLFNLDLEMYKDSFAAYAVFCFFFQCLFSCFESFTKQIENMKYCKKGIFISLESLKKLAKDFEEKEVEEEKMKEINE